MADSQKKICVLLSGGLDSALLLQKAVDEKSQAYPLYVACGFLWEPSEQAAMQNLLKHLAQPLLQPLQTLYYPLKEIFPHHWGFHQNQVPDSQAPDEEVYIPGRNLLLLTQAALYCESQNLEEIWLGTLKANPFPDAREEFFRSLSENFTSALQRNIKIQAPFAQLNKAQLIQQYPHFPYELTLSCLQSHEGKHCGACNKCEERRRYFEEAGVKDPTSYDAS